jgi:hypothetical protein
MKLPNATNVRLLSALLVLGLGLAACAPPTGDEEPGDDDQELWDEGPPDGSGDGDEATATSSDGLSVSAFQLPFRCGQVWSGQTRSNHSPVNSVDFNRADDIGDAVVASAGGTVSRVANEGNTSYGRWIEINHGDGYTTRYAHLNSQLVSVGQKVGKGQKIGTVGSTGGSSGPHLHFELRRNGTAIRPVFNGVQALFFGTKNYKSQNCGGGGDPGGSGFLATVNTTGPSLTVRKKATSNSAALGAVGDGQKIRIKCQKVGQSVTGTYGTSKIWNYIGTGYVADAYVYTGSDGRVAPNCD